MISCQLIKKVSNVDKVVVSSESEEILSVAKRLGVDIEGLATVGLTRFTQRKGDVYVLHNESRNSECGFRDSG